MSIGMFWAVPLIAFSALTVLAQDPPELQEPVASLVPVDQQESKITAAAAAANPRAVAYCPGDCTGFSASTGNLYFTSHYVNEFGPDSASFHRTSKSGVPGSAGLLYEEVGPPVGSFGRPVWANVNGAYYGYFSASRYNNPGLTYEIKRVPLGGGAAITLAYLPGPINSLETDGSHLFWADPTGIRRMPIGGGAIQNLLSVHVATRFNIRLNGTYVYYSLAREIKRIPKAGGASALMVTASDVVTSFYVTGGLFATIFWANREERSGVPDSSERRRINSRGASEQ